MTTTPRFVAGTRPYPWPWHGALEPRSTALVVVGVQQVHADASVGVGEVLGRIDALSAAARAAGATVCHVHHVGHGRRARPLLPSGTDPSVRPVVQPAADDLVVVAAGHDGFVDSPLDEVLRARGIDTLVVVGLAAEVAVSSTVRSANDRGYECLTVEDAAAPLSPETGARELHSVTMSGGIFGAVGRSGAVLDALATPPSPHPDPSQEHS